MTEPTPEPLVCSFHGQPPEGDAMLIVAKDPLTICTDCVGLMMGMMAQVRPVEFERQVELARHYASAARDPSSN